MSIAGNGGTRAVKTEEGNKYNAALNENKIDRVDLFFFKQDNSLHSILENVKHENQKLTVVVSGNKIASYEGQTLKAVAVVNRETSVSINDVTNLNQLKAKVQETVNLNPNPASPQPYFLMDGEVSTGAIQWGNSQTYNVPQTLQLYRAASKIRLRISDVNVKNREGGVDVQYEMEGMPHFKLVHYTRKTSLLKENPYTKTPQDWFTTDYSDARWIRFNDLSNTQDPKHPNEFLTTQYPFYSYENDWSTEEKYNDETYLMVKINLKKGTSPAKPYYYRVPVNYRFETAQMTEEQKKGLRKLQRNYLYDVLTSIRVLGSEEEGTPVDVDANIAVEPWREFNIDGDIKNIHFLVVKELNPLMPNISERRVEYVSDQPVKVRILKTKYVSYNFDGDEIPHEKENKKNENPFDKVSVTVDDLNPQKTFLKIKHPVPENFVPYEIFIKVTQELPPGETSTPLSQEIHVVQYPPKYVTGRKSEGFKMGSSEYADFRYHDYLGSLGRHPGSDDKKTQKNNVFYTITTVVNEGEERIGDPTDSEGRTKRDAISNKLISPQFIIATQHGMTIPIPQYVGGTKYDGWTTTHFGQGFGPFSNKFPKIPPYYKHKKFEEKQNIYKSYTNAGNRCDNYFEGEYGLDGYYIEHYLNKDKDEASRKIYKTFKYKGRWRIPTAAELKYIDKIQDNEKSAVKSLLWGEKYWSAEENKAYGFYDNKPIDMDSKGQAPVRCVFDIYKFPEK
nr:fimbrial protein [Porphyromonas macacae]